jgi:hypothetical protein
MNVTKGGAHMEALLGIAILIAYVGGGGGKAGW